MKKRFLLAMIMILILTFFSSCSKDGDLALGAYGTAEENNILQLTLEKDQKFTFANIVLSLMPSNGTFSIENEKLCLATDNNSIVVFDIEGKNLIFDKEKSSFSEDEYPSLKELDDGKRFEFMSTK